MIIYSILIGLLSGLVLSLFGGGAGLIAIPGIYWVLYHYTSYHEQLMQITVTTSFAMAAPLGMIAAIRHFAYQNIDRTMLARLLFPVLLGAAVGAAIVSAVESNVLKIYFGIMILAIAIWVARFKAEPKKIWRPSPLKLKTATAIVGLVSMTVGVSVFTMPFLMKLGLNIKKAIGTSSVMVFSYTLLGAIALILLGLSRVGITHHRLGYLYIPIFLSAIIPAIVGSIVGAKIVHILPERIIRTFCIVMMGAVGIMMLASGHLKF